MKRNIVPQNRGGLSQLFCSLLLAQLLLLSVISSVYAGDIIYSDAIGMRPTNWNDVLQIPQFDPTLGQLSSIELNLVTDVKGIAAFENLGPNTSSVTLTHGARVEISLPNIDSVFNIPTSVYTTTLPPFDFEFDNDGTSGKTITMEATQLVSNTYMMDTELAAFIGTGLVTIPISATGVADSTGPGNFAVLLRSNASASSLAITYNFEIPNIEIETWTNGFDADGANDIDVPMIASGNEITWTYTVVNSGQVAFAYDEVAVTDSVSGVTPNFVPTSDNGDLILEPGEEWIYEYSTSATDLSMAGDRAPIVQGCDAGATGYTLPTYENHGTVTVVQYELKDTDPTHHCNEPERSLRLQKLTNDIDVDANVSANVPLLQPGSPITWTYLVENNGEGVYALNEISLTDNDSAVHPLFDPTSDTNGDELLYPGETWRYLATGVAQNLDRPQPGTTVVRGCGPDPADANRPAYQNIASLIADGTVVNDASYYCQARNTTIEIEKLTNGFDADGANDADVPQIHPGEPVTWTYRVRNTGVEPVALSDVQVTDSQVGIKPLLVPVSDKGNDGILSPGEVWDFQAESIAQYLQIPHPEIMVVDGCNATNGSVVREAYQNIGTVSVGTVSDSDPSHYCNPPAPQISVEKLTNGIDADDPNSVGIPEVAPGEPIIWTYLVHNSGNVPFRLPEIQVTDSDTGLTPTLDTTSDLNSDQILSSGETWIYVATGTAVNLMAPPPTVQVVAGCQLVNSGAPNPVYMNGVTVTAPDTTATDLSHYCNPPLADVTIEKMTNGEDGDDPNDPLLPTLSVGDVVTWTYIVENTGNVAFPAAEITVTDSDPAVIPEWLPYSDRGADGILSPGERWYYIFFGAAQDLRQPAAGTIVVDGCDPDSTGIKKLAYQNIVTVVADSVSDTDPSHYCMSTERHVEIQKLTNGIDVPNSNDLSVPHLSPGDRVKWTYLVTNSGTEAIPLAEIVVTDSDPEVIPQFDPSSDDGLDKILRPGEMWEYHASGTVDNLSDSGADPGVRSLIVQGCTLGETITPRATYQNVGAVRAGNTAASDLSYYCNPIESLELQKLTNDASASYPNGIDVPTLTSGTTVTWTYVVTNTGEVPYRLSDVAITDSDSVVEPIWVQASDTDGDQLLSPNETWLFTAVGEVQILEMNHAALTVVVGCDDSAEPSTLRAYENLGAIRIGQASARDKSHYCNPITPDFAVQKLTNGHDADNADGLDVPAIPLTNLGTRTSDTVKWTYMLTNTGTIAINQRHIEITESDTTLTPVLDQSSDIGRDGILSVGESWTYFAEALPLDLHQRSGDERVVEGCQGSLGSRGFAYRNVVTVTIGLQSKSDPSHYCNATPTSLDRISEPAYVWAEQIFVPLFSR